MAELANRVQETSTTTGTGTLTLAGAVTGYVTFNSAFSNGDVVFYTIDDGLGNWEIGAGTIGTGTLARTTVIESSNSNSLVPFGSGAKRVFCTAPTRALLPDQTSNNGKVLTTDGTSPSWTTPASGTVTSVSVASANGLAGTSSGGATPSLTLSTTVTGVLKGNGTAISAAVAGTDYVTPTGTETLTNKTLTNPTVTNYVESVVAIGTVTTSNTLSLTNGTVQTATLTASTACTFTMPTATAGKSFILLLKQAPTTGNGTATFTGVKWGSAGAPTITSTAARMDILTFVSDGVNWYGSIAQGYTP